MLSTISTCTCINAKFSFRFTLSDQRLKKAIKCLAYSCHETFETVLHKTYIVLHMVCILNLLAQKETTITWDTESLSYNIGKVDCAVSLSWCGRTKPSKCKSCQVFTLTCWQASLQAVALQYIRRKRIPIPIPVFLCPSHSVGLELSLAKKEMQRCSQTMMC